MHDTHDPDTRDIFGLVFLVCIAGAVAGAVCGWLARLELYGVGGWEGLGLLWGAATGLLAAIIWCHTMLGACRRDPPVQPVRYGTGLGLAVGVLAGVLLHVGLMIGTGEIAIEAKVAGLASGVLVGALVGFVCCCVCRGEVNNARSPDLLTDA